MGSTWSRSAEDEGRRLPSLSMNMIHPCDQSWPLAHSRPSTEGQSTVGWRCFTAASLAWLIWLTSDAIAAAVRWLSRKAVSGGSATTARIDRTETVVTTSTRVKPGGLEFIAVSTRASLPAPTASTLHAIGIKQEGAAMPVGKIPAAAGAFLTAVASRAGEARWCRLTPADSAPPAPSAADH